MPRTAPKIDAFLTWIENYARQKTEIKRVVLYGSFARGDAADMSDIDLAFELSDADRWPVIAEEVRGNPVILRKLDLVRLDTVGPVLKKKILQEGRILYERKR